jgi:hypothetical protein
MRDKPFQLVSLRGSLVFCNGVVFARAFAAQSKPGADVVVTVQPQ